MNPHALEPRSQPDPALIEQITQALSGLKFGALEIVVHDGRVVQIERRERYRFDKPHDVATLKR